jgi:hypothetical protein
MVSCPCCCGGYIGGEPSSTEREGVTRAPSQLSRGLRVLLAIVHLYGTDSTILRAHPLYLSRELTIFGYFEEGDPPDVGEVERAQELIGELR